MKLEYIASALSFVFTSQFERMRTPEALNTVHDMVNKANSWYDYHSFGVLFNAYNEPEDGPYHVEYFSPYSIQVDSGGLQMITLGHTPTDELRDKVYRTQAKFGTHAMCFDEIPLRTDGKSQFVNAENRRYDRSMVDECTKQTAKNICKQIDVFDEVGSKCKPFMIIQGNDIDTYQEWTDKLLKHIPQDYQSKLAGIASGGGCLGNGELEDVERYFTLAKLEAPSNLTQQFHLLGVGSPNRIQTLMKMQHLFRDDQLISYDSTKHTGGVVRSQVQVGSQIWMIGRHRTQTYWKIWHLFDTFQKTKLGLNFTEEQFHDNLLLSMTDRCAKTGMPEENVQALCDLNLIRFALLLFSVNNLFEMVDTLKNETTFVSKTKKKQESLYRTLNQLNTVDDFKKWKRDYGKYVESKRTKSVGDETSSLETFF